MTFFKKTFLLCLIAFASLVAQAQDGLEVGGWLGICNYFGDLNTNLRLNRINPAGGIGFRYNFNERLAVKLSANMGSVEAYDADSPNIFERARNLHFKSTVADAGLAMEFNFLPYNHGSKDENWTPLPVFGHGRQLFQPQSKNGRRMVRVAPVGYGRSI
ncbi:MAG: DUF6089 family protein [Saprospiraceae bacterium]